MPEDVLHTLNTNKFCLNGCLKGDSNRQAWERKCEMKRNRCIPSELVVTRHKYLELLRVNG